MNKLHVTQPREKEKCAHVSANKKEQLSDGVSQTSDTIENRLNIKEFAELQSLFKSPGLSQPECMNREEFMEKTYTALGHGNKEEYGELFDKIDVSREGFIDWDKLTSFMLLELYEKDERAKSSAIPQWKDIRSLPLIHKENIQNVVYLKGSCLYITLSKDGLLGVWGENLKLQRNPRISTDTVKLKDLWATSLVFLGNVNKIAVAFTSKEICFYDLNSKQDLFCQYKLQGLKGTPICMDYWHNPDDANEAILTFGDVIGQVQAICFTTALISLFERPACSAEDQQTTVYITWNELVSGYHKCCFVLRHKLHDNHWVRQVSYNSNLEVLLSCSTSDNNTVILAWREKGKSHLRTSFLNIAKGINGFDYHPGLNLIATAGIDHKICLWNPFVVSKPTGVLQGNMTSVIAVKFFGIRKQLCSFSKEKILRIWDVHHQVCIQRIAGIFPKTLDYQFTFYFSEPHGRLFLSFNNQLTVLEMKKESAKKVVSHEKPVTCVLYNSAFKQVISSDTGSTITFWMMDTGQKIKQFSGCHGSAEISTMALNSSGTRLLTGSTDGTVKYRSYWETYQGYQGINLAGDSMGKVLSSHARKRSLAEHGEWGHGLPIGNLRDCYHILSKSIHLDKNSEWNMKIQSVCLSLCGNYFDPQAQCIGHYKGGLFYFNSHMQSSSRTLHPCPPQLIWGSPKQYSELQSAGKRQISSSSSGRHTRSVSNLNTDSDSNNTVTRLFFLEARKHASATGGANLISCGGSGCVRFWNIYKGSLIAEFVAHEGASFIIMAVDKSNQYIFTGDHCGWVKVWDIQEYCIDHVETILIEPPHLVASFQPHSDCITHLETCTHTKYLLIISASADCSICVSDVYGTTIGIFGQEDHWSMENYVPLHVPNNVLENPEEKLIGSRDIQTEGSDPPLSLHFDNHLTDFSTEDKEEMPYETSPLEDIASGSKYRETLAKERMHSNIREDSFQNSVGIFSLLNIGTLNDITEVNKPDFIINPEKYFGEKIEDNTSNELKHHNLPQTLKAVFDEGSLFPREILERERAAKQLKEKMHQDARRKRNNKTARPKEK
ncbi:WD repeat-containing 49 [Pelobates cultripes]|uniref:WD repeat-containing 49 n=1 Tax=Pelobates cultripes TaxID=61616 RepID=A0AAD1RBV3_PELCU|nr:WD repeat-containing 49 [Pelobates cultripes]